MLVYAIRESDKERVGIWSTVIDRLTFGINPFVAGSYGTGTASTDSGDAYASAASRGGQVQFNNGKVRHQGVNSEFERHSRSARETGRPDLSPEMRKAIAAIYSKSPDQGQRTTLSVAPSAATKAPQSDPEELG